MKEHTLPHTLITLTAALALGAGAMAEGLSKSGYKAGLEKIESDYVSAKVACDEMTANAHDICLARAKGAERVARAELEASYKPSAKTRNQVRVVKAKSDYAAAREQYAGDIKEQHLSTAKATYGKL